MMKKQHEKKPLKVKGFKEIGRKQFGNEEFIYLKRDKKQKNKSR